MRAAKIHPIKQNGRGAREGNLVNAREGLVNPRIFVDPEIYRQEQERIFTRTWLYVAHESEIPQSGDFVTRTMGEDGVIVARGADGKVRVFLNACRHRGMPVCREDMGKTSSFMCGYHGWRFSISGELIGVPFFEGYQGKLDKESLGLHQAPCVDSYHGLIFANWDPDGETLSDYLGEMRWTLDLLFGRTEALEVVGPPMRWTVDTNWKLPAANFGGDGTHLFTTHGFRWDLGLEGKQPGRRAGYRMITPNGHTASLSGFLDGDLCLALPKELRPEMESRLTREQLEMMKSLLIIVGNVFPNMSFLNSGQHTPGEWGGAEGEAVSFLTLRQWQPRGPDRMEVWSWCFVDKNASAQWKEASRQCYLRIFGMAGVFEQDDMENWVEISRALRGPVASRLWLQYKLGLGSVSHEPRPVPALRSLEHSGFSEESERAFYSHWEKLITQA